MECESESTETMIIFWKLLNQVLETFTGKKGYKFNPVGWSVDEHGGNWASIKAVYGEEALKRTVSCEFHFKQSVIHHANNLHSTKSQRKFKVLADKLMSATCKSYEEAYLELKGFIDKKPKKREFLNRWLEWWNNRKSHFARAFKPVDGARVNLSEVYHSCYARTGSVGLRLVDAAYKDMELALRLERSLEPFGKGVKCQGNGPSSTKRCKKDFAAQSRRADEYADVLLEDDMFDDVGDVHGVSKDHEKVEEESSSSSEGETQVDRKRKQKTKKNERGERLAYIYCNIYLCKIIFLYKKTIASRLKNKAILL
jgi:hypothetical protein